MPFTAFSVFEHLAGSALNSLTTWELQYPAAPITNRSTDTNPTAKNMASKANLKSSGREAALARRRAMSTKGKQGVGTSSPERSSPGRTGRVRRAAAVAPESAPIASAVAPNSALSTPAAQPASGSSWGSSAMPLSDNAPKMARRTSNPPPSPAQTSRALARQRRGALAQSGRKAVRGGDRVRAADQVKRAASAAAQEKDRGCKCNGECKKSSAQNQAQNQQSATLSLASGLGNDKPKPRSKRTDAALAAKPTGRMLSLARRAALSGRGKSASQTPNSAAGLARQANPKLSGRELAQKVRAHRSNSGGAGERKSRPTGRVRPTVDLQGAADQPWKVAVTETAMGQRVTGTKVGRSTSTTGDEPGTCRTITGTEYMGADIFREFCQTEQAPGVPKFGVSSTGHGNRVTGNEVGRSTKVTGDEPGTCKQITGTEYLSADHYQAFCQTAPGTGSAVRPNPAKVGITQTLGGKQVSGNLVGRSAAVTGDEQGANVRPTGTQYTAPSDIGTEIVPPKVGRSTTLGGGTVTGNRVGRSERVTGDEPGNCHLVTGDQYIDREHHLACEINPQPEPPGTGLSITNKGLRVSGTQTGRSAKVTGDEPGTCKAITGTPYAGLEQAADYCEPSHQQEIQARTRVLAATPGPKLTGIQPGIDPPNRNVPGKFAPSKMAPFGIAPRNNAPRNNAPRNNPPGNDAPRNNPPRNNPPANNPPGNPANSNAGNDGGRITGASKGACEPLTGTPYVGADQFEAACGGNGAAPGDADFPRLLDGSAPWQGFSVTSPARQSAEIAEARSNARSEAVTGTRYESSHHITGPFGMGSGKITGTEQFRFDARRPLADATRIAAAESADAGNDQAAEVLAQTSRITGEGQSAGSKITGDDWERGNRVTGTEGTSARRRNPTRPGPMSAMPSLDAKRNEEVPKPVSRVTGASGSTDRGSLVTYSGGARG
jgi:hypothetical protein